MALPTSPTTAQLDAVNEMLMSVGQTPVTQLEATNPDVALAFETLTQVSRGVQAEGWTFNRENHLSTFAPDSTTKKIQIPTGYQLFGYLIRSRIIGFKIISVNEYSNLIPEVSNT